MNRSVVVVLVVVAWAAPGCRKDTVRPEAPRPRVVSLSPALTSILFEMGLGDHVVGVTGFCVLPPGERRMVVGSYINADVEAILSTEPDLVLVERILKDFDALARVRPGVKVELFSVRTFEEITAAVDRLGLLTGREEAAREARERFLAKLQAVERSVANLPRPRVLFSEGYERPLVAGTDNFIDEMIQRAGGINCGRAVRGQGPWRTTNVEGILAAAPDVLLCRSEMGREEVARKYWLSVKDLPAAVHGRVFILTNSRWTIPSTHLADLTARLAEMIHPELGGQGDQPATPKGPTNREAVN